VTGATAEASDVVVQQLGAQLAALERRLTSANRPGNLDGLFAYHVLSGTDVSFTWDVDPLTEPWLDRHAERLSDAPVLAALGYGLTHFARYGNDDVRTKLVDGLRNLMRRDPLPADGVTFIHDSRQMLGIALAAAVAEASLSQVHGWLLETLADSRFRAGGAHLDLFRRHVRAMLTDQPALLANPTSSDDLVDLALMYWMVTAGTARFADPIADLRVVQHRVLTGLLQTDVDDFSVSEAALLRAAAGRIVDASIDRTMLNRSHGPAPATEATLVSPRVAVVLTALEVEYNAVRGHLTDRTPVPHRTGTLFEVGTLPGCGRRVALAVLGEGNQTAAVIAERAATMFRPDLVLFAGVAGALHDDLALGDIVVGTRVYAYHSGQDTPDGFQARPRAWDASHRLEQRARYASRAGRWQELLADPSAPPAVHFRAIAAGEVVVTTAYSPHASILRTHYGDAAAIEMEGAGLARAAHLHDAMPALVVRGISDYADDRKHSMDRAGWQRIAAANAAAFALGLVADLPLDE